MGNKNTSTSDRLGHNGEPTGFWASTKKSAKTFDRKQPDLFGGVLLKKFFCTPSSKVGWYYLLLAVGNFLGPLMLGRLFDTVGRRWMIAATYAISGVLIAINGYLFLIGVVSPRTLSLAWTFTFFFASAAASAAYLTAGEIFPLEIRALAMAFFFAIGTVILGGVINPSFFTTLIINGGRESLCTLINEGRESLYSGYLVLSGTMILAALIELLWGPKAEGKPLEIVAPPLSSADAEQTKNLQQASR
jgi:MFS family permease